MKELKYSHIRATWEQGSLCVIGDDRHNLGAKGLWKQNKMKELKYSHIRATWEQGILPVIGDDRHNLGAKGLGDYNMVFL